MPSSPAEPQHAEPFDAVSVIRAKRDRGRIPDAEIDWVIDAYTRGVVADEQMAALAMAILLNGMATDELARWTEAMIASGQRLDLSAVRRPTTDKHSTGGVGDKITLPLAPLVAALGAAVPQLSGRGLGHTGGTLDKLESIPGWRAKLSNAEFLAQLDSVGAVICAAGDELAPADRKLYALRDVTGTVEAIPLIASSIMSKKIAEGSAALVLDVKVGTGAFMKTRQDARTLAETMVALGTAAGTHTVALLTDMSTPLGLTAGNALEVREAVEVLAGGGPADVVELTVALAVEMLAGAGITGVDPAEALADGRAMDVWRAMIAAQGGDPGAELPVAAEKQVLTAPATGVLTRLDAYAVGVAAWRLGAGRARKEDPVSAGAGVVLLAKPGDPVRAGQPLLELHTDDPARFERALQALEGGFDIGDGAGVAAGPLVIERVTA
jgi:thymidine phosphorylase